MPCLGCPGSMGRVERESVTLQHDDIFEIVGESTRGGQARHSCANHDRPPADQCGRHQSLL